MFDSPAWKRSKNAPFRLLGRSGTGRNLSRFTAARQTRPFAPRTLAISARALGTLGAYSRVWLATRTSNDSDLNGSAVADARTRSNAGSHTRKAQRSTSIAMTRLRRSRDTR